MSKKLFMMFAMVMALSGAFFTIDASAQGNPQCRIVFVEESIDDPPPPPPVATVPAATDTANTDTDTADTDTDTADTDTDSANIVGSADVTAVHSCADAVAYPGPFTNMPVTPASPFAAPVGLSATVPSAPVVPAEPAGAGLAHSGSETYVLAYLGTGFLAFGAVALGIRRSSISE